MNFVRFSATAVAVIGLSQAAFADETTAFNGAYVGLNGGYSSIQSDAPQAQGDGFSCWWEFCDVTYSASGSGVAGGLTAGYNIRNESLVLGFEADMAATTPSGSSQQIGTESYSAALNYLGTLRARAGILTGSTLVYVTGGLAYGQVENAWIDSGYETDGFDTKRWATGWTAGAGVEAALGSNWSAKAEGLYYDLGNNIETAEWEAADFGFKPENTGFIARIGLNFDLN